MAKRDEIIEGLAKEILLQQRTNRDYVYRRPCWEELGISAKLSYLEKANEILSYLHSQGVVIKVERELPLFVQEARDWGSVERIRGKLAGYVAVEPLIKEEANELVE